MKHSLFNVFLRLVGIKNHVHHTATGCAIDHRNLPGVLVGSRILDRSWEVGEGANNLKGNAGDTTANSAYSTDDEFVCIRFADDYPALPL